jgi:hypothetical protein
MKSRRVRWAGHVAWIGKKRNACRILVGTVEGKIPLGRPRRRWLYNNRMDPGEIEWDDWIDVGQVTDQCMALVKTVINFRVP